MIEFKPERQRYHIEKTVGEGLSAVVYEAIRLDSRGHSQQKVALKILKDRNAVSYLRREFDALSRVNSPHCARVIAWENSGGDCALVLEWIDGMTLLELGRAHRLDNELTTEVIAQVSAGLRSLSEFGLHHGDLHPKNVMIDRDGRVVVLDFAVQPCRVVGERRGAPAYLAPEIWEGAPTSLDSDIFALGLIALDLKTQFARAPTTLSGAKHRATQVSETSSGAMTSRDPALRRIGPEVSAPKARERLAKLVCAELDKKDSMLRTAVIERRSNAASRLSVAASFALIVSVLIPVSLPVRAEAPVGAQSKTANLVFRSNRWVDMSLNGVSIGFAPIRIDGLSAGSHRLKWRTARNSGEIHFKLTPGQTIQFSERDLEQTFRPDR